MFTLHKHFQKNTLKRPIYSSEDSITKLLRGFRVVGRLQSPTDENWATLMLLCHSLKASVYKKVYLPDNLMPLYVAAYRTTGYNEPVILLTDMVAEDFEMALKIRNLFTHRWDCETSVEFLKSRIGLERFAVRRCKSM